MPTLNKDNVKKAVENFENENGTKLKDFSVKEIVIIFHKEMTDKIDNVDEKIDKHIEWGQKEDTRFNKALADHDKLFQQIIDILPEKGFCAKVENALELNKEVTLADRVNTMWHDRRWIKRLLGILITLTAVLGGGNIVLQL